MSISLEQYYEIQAMLAAFSAAIDMLQNDYGAKAEAAKLWQDLALGEAAIEKIGEQIT